MTKIVEIDPRDISITPFFKMVNLENVPKSEHEGRRVMEMMEVVEVRFAGSNNYAPVFPSNAFWKREGNKVITYAERWPEQYRTYKEGNPQEAMGTPLEMLSPYGVTPEQLSLCRVHRIYSIEALSGLEDKALKTLGMAGNGLKALARRYMADRGSGEHALDEIAKLKAEIASLKATKPEAVSTAIPSNEEELLEVMTDEELRVMIEQKTGAKPDGRLNRTSLVNLAKGI